MIAYKYLASPFLFVKGLAIPVTIISMIAFHYSTLEILFYYANLFFKSLITVIYKFVGAINTMLPIVRKRSFIKQKIKC